jgi:Uma2 family endonuclease
MAEPAKRMATYADLEAVSPLLVAEIIHGALVTHPRPSPRHSVGSFALSGRLTDQLRDSWIFTSMIEWHTGGDVLVPDIAGWRRERMPDISNSACMETPPDWVCEILSDATERYDRNAKRDIYAGAGVPYLWLLDPKSKLLEVFQLTAGHWLLAATFVGQDEIRAVPFEEIAFPLSELWPLDTSNPS